MSNQSNSELIDFVKTITIAITTLSESGKQTSETLGALKEVISNQSIANTKAFENLSGKDDVLGSKMDNLFKVFLYVITSLIGVIAALVGVKYIFKIP